MVRRLVGVHTHTHTHTHTQIDGEIDREIIQH